MPLTDSTATTVTGTTHASTALTDSDGELSASGCDQASVRPRHAVRVRRDRRRRSLAEEEGREPDSDRDQARDRQHMEYTECALSMQRECGHVHDDEREDVDGSDRSVRVCALGRQEHSGTRTECREGGQDMCGGDSLFHVDGDHSDRAWSESTGAARLDRAPWADAEDLRKLR